MGDIKHINFPLTKEDFDIAVDIKNGESWEYFFMRLVKEEKQRREECQQLED